MTATAPTTTPIVGGKAFPYPGPGKRIAGRFLLAGVTYLQGLATLFLLTNLLEKKQDWMQNPDYMGPYLGGLGILAVFCAYYGPGQAYLPERNVGAKITDYRAQLTVAANLIYGIVFDGPDGGVVGFSMFAKTTGANWTAFGCFLLAKALKYNHTIGLQAAARNNIDLRSTTVGRYLYHPKFVQFMTLLYKATFPLLIAYAHGKANLTIAGLLNSTLATIGFGLLTIICAGAGFAVTTLYDLGTKTLSASDFAFVTTELQDGERQEFLERPNCITKSVRSVTYAYDNNPFMRFLKTKPVVIGTSIFYGLGFLAMSGVTLYQNLLINQTHSNEDSFFIQSTFGSVDKAATGSMIALGVLVVSGILIESICKGIGIHNDAGLPSVAKNGCLRQPGIMVNN